MPTFPSAVLTSGGLDSAILVAHQARLGGEVSPIYIRSGLAWESVELEHLHRYLHAIHPHFPNLQPLVVLDQPTRDLYGVHWSTTGEKVPDASTPDEAVYLPGRNLLLTLKGLLWCHLHGVKQLALGVLSSNPFPDASPAFFQHFAAAIGEGVNDPQLRILTPFGQLHKVEVMQHGQGLPLELSFSCIQPVDGLHCGRCNKCAERIKAFHDTGMKDGTEYRRQNPEVSNQ
ncbi:MAG: 7-cyano-7-deazaguanine synthase [Gemmatales bacterium]